ncbi:amino acid ABC transporter permease [Ruminococcus sp.]|uniref:amino acid ABC transporter permease n=1 Tax=Ruminococcus sp. TaxID=41978 RepID=UPI00389034B8
MKRKRIIAFLICAVVIVSMAVCFCMATGAAGAADAPSGGEQVTSSWFDDIKAQFKLNFIDKDRWKSLLGGLGNTLRITLYAALLGVAIGIVIAAIRTTYDNNRENMKHSRSIGYYVLGFFNAISKIYLTVIRGTPVVVQLLIIYFIIFATSNNDIMIASLAFGINSGAYVAEILRGGIMSIDKGQFEAGRSTGFNYVQTMYYIIIPQVLKNVLPTLLNEFIALLKETSVAGYVGVVDLTRAGNAIRGATFSAFMPLIAVALIYLVIVLVLTWIVGIIERRLRKSER